MQTLDGLTAQQLGDAVFSMLRDIYGAAAIRRFEVGVVGGEGVDECVKQAAHTWGAFLIERGFEMRDIGAALHCCCDYHPRWAPTLPEFMAIVRAEAAMRERLDLELAARVDDPADMTPAAREAEMEAIRAILKAAQVKERGRGSPKKANAAQGSLLTGLQGIG